ncbi:MAG TPA: hypothetical protein VFO19_18475 [Vicinamibacterales bacterium]|nr:hypothetical protein [Vicinamibacterales bacterium]
MSRIASVLFVLMLAVPATAESATSIRDLVQLKAAGLSDDILIALIQSDGSVFNLTADDIIEVRRQGLSEPVILAMLATRKRPQPSSIGTREANPSALAAAGSDEPTMTPAENEATAQSSQYETVEAPPVTVKVEQHVTQTQTVEAPEPQVQYVPYPVAYPVYPVAPIYDRKPAKPLYWGFGGERRPDAWQPIGGLRSDPRASQPSTPAKPSPGATPPRIKGKQ